MEEMSQQKPKTTSESGINKSNRCLCCGKDHLLINIAGAYAICLLLFGCVYSITIDYNFYFDDTFYYVYIFCLFPIIISGMFFLFWWCMCDKALIPAALIIATSCSLLIFVWIIVYIYAIYPHEHVWVGSGPAAAEGDEELNYHTE